MLQSLDQAFDPSDDNAEVACERYDALVLKDKQEKIALFEKLKNGGLYFDNGEL